MLFKIDWASLIVGRKFTVFVCFTLYLRAISKYKPPGGLYLGGRFNRDFFELQFWRAYIWRGLYMEGLIFGILRYFAQSLWCPHQSRMFYLMIIFHIGLDSQVYLTVNE